SVIWHLVSIPKKSVASFARPYLPDTTIAGRVLIFVKRAIRHAIPRSSVGRETTVVLHVKEVLKTRRATKSLRCVPPNNARAASRTDCASHQHVSRKGVLIDFKSATTNVAVAFRSVKNDIIVRKNVVANHEPAAPIGVETNPTCTAAFYCVIFEENELLGSEIVLIIPATVPKAA